AICDLLDEPGEATADELRTLGHGAFYAHVDVTQSAEIEQFVERVHRELGPIDILVNNVGAGSGGRSLEDEEDERWRTIIDVNLSSMFYVAKPVVRRMIERGQGGAIINMASMSSLIINNIAPRHNTPYCVSKAGVAHLTKGMASNWAQHGIRVNAIAPGYMDTDQTYWMKQNPELEARLLANVPLGRYGNADELKGAVVYLASSASSFMTGHIMVIDGGTTIW
ncbi:MAG: SDR family oxidoreductase, partial [Caldilineaceae bacterium]|nr:SDR family oxidoreductase [Caldilineaceae bacterium]